MKPVDIKNANPGAGMMPNVSADNYVSGRDLPPHVLHGALEYALQVSGTEREIPNNEVFERINRKFGWR